MLYSGLIFAFPFFLFSWCFGLDVTGGMSLLLSQAFVSATPVGKREMANRKHVILCTINSYIWCAIFSKGTPSQPQSSVHLCVSIQSQWQHHPFPFCPLHSDTVQFPLYRLHNFIPVSGIPSTVVNLDLSQICMFHQKSYFG